MSNDTQALTLTEFLLACIAEDESVARTAQNVGSYPHFGDNAAEECWQMAKHEGCSPDGYRFHRHNTPARILAECEAKRGIVNLHGKVDPCDAHDGATLKTVVCDTLLYLAAVYADHPDYREEWKP